MEIAIDVTTPEEEQTDNKAQVPEEDIRNSDGRQATPLEGNNTRDGNTEKDAGG